MDVDQVVGVITLPPQMKDPPQEVPFHEETIPVFPLEKVLELEEKTRFSPPEIIVLRHDNGNYGLCVDWVGEIFKVPFISDTPGNN